MFKESEAVEGLNKSEFKEVFPLATKDSHFIVDGELYGQIEGTLMIHLFYLKFVAAIFYQNFIFHQMIALEKL